jgi:hypothetical protein
MESNKDDAPVSRLQSIDDLRGFDMLMISGAVAFISQKKNWWSSKSCRQ